MIERSLVSGLTVYLLAIRLLALIVKKGDRAEWKRQWASELWYVYDTCVGRGPRSARGLRQGHVAVATFCFGAFHDACSMRGTTCASGWSEAAYARSASRCFVILAAANGFSFLCFLLAPGARNALEPSTYRDPRTLVVISREGFSETLLPTIPVAQYSSWRSSSQHLFTDFALYQPANQQLHAGPHRDLILSIASVTPNLFNMLGLPAPSIETDRGEGTPSLLVSRAVWRKDFGGSPLVFGRVFEVGSRKVRLAGILDEGAWRVPGKADAWIIERDEDASMLRATSLAFVIAREPPTGAAISLGERWHMSVGNDGSDPALKDDEFLRYDCVALTAITRRPLDIFLFTALLALLALPATTSLPLGEYPSVDRQLTLGSRTRRWAFFFTKCALTFPVVLFSSLALAHLSTGIDSVHAQYIQIATSFGGCLYGLRWALRDQRARCPVCLSKLSHACRVGEASRNFLAWNGTELLCSDGHGLLHVPDLPTCWFPTQRWIYLDASWTALFGASS